MELLLLFFFRSIQHGVYLNELLFIGAGRDPHNRQQHDAYQEPEPEHDRNRLGQSFLIEEVIEL